MANNGKISYANIGKESKNMKKIITTLALIALLATMAMGLVACTETNLDGTYYDVEVGYRYDTIRINGNLIQFFENDNGQFTLLYESTYVRKDDMLILDLVEKGKNQISNFGVYIQKVRVSEKKNISVTYSHSGTFSSETISVYVKAK